MLIVVKEAKTRMKRRAALTNDDAGAQNTHGKGMFPMPIHQQLIRHRFRTGIGSTFMWLRIGKVGPVITSVLLPR